MKTIEKTNTAVEAMSEHNIQRLLVAWIRQQYPRVTVFAIPNGSARNKATAARLKSEGVLAGVPDIFLAFPHGGYAGLFVELKTAKGTASKVQRGIHARLRTSGYRVEVTKGYEAAKIAVSVYMQGNC